MVLVPLLAWRPKMRFQSPHGVGARQLNEHPRVWIAKQSFAEFSLKAKVSLAQAWSCLPLVPREIVPTLKQSQRWRLGTR